MTFQIKGCHACVSQFFTQDLRGVKISKHESGTGWESAALPGSTWILWCIHTVWMRMVLTKAIALLQLKEVGSCGKDAPDTSICAGLQHLSVGDHVHFGLVQHASTFFVRDICRQVSESKKSTKMAAI